MDFSDDELRELITAAKERLDRERKWRVSPRWKALERALAKLEGRPPPEDRPLPPPSKVIAMPPGRRYRLAKRYRR